MTFKTTVMVILPLAAVILVSSAGGQEMVKPDLKSIPEGKGWKTVNRTVTVAEQDGRTVAEFDGKPGDGMAWLDGFTFSNGIIECDILGRSTPMQGSFVGIAFGVHDAETFEAVYFRPFNFRSDDPVRQAHSVQYVSHPDWTWSRLRQEKPGQYEKPIESPPHGDQWFHVRIVIDQPKISVYINNSKNPCLVGESLSGRRNGSVAFWVGNNSPGKFADLKIAS